MRTRDHSALIRTITKLRAGADVGRRRTWQEVATEVGYSQSYVRRLAEQDQSPPAVAEPTSRRIPPPPIDAAVISALLDDHLRDKQLNVRDFAAKVGMAETYVRAVRGGQQTRLSTVSAGRLLAAMGQPMRPEIRTAYSEWARNRKKR